MAKVPVVEVSTLSLKDAQRCFDKERHAFLRDIESLRQQLVRKDQTAARAAAAASTHAIQLKREIAALQTTMATLEAERAKFQGQFTHTSSLLETALDQRQEDQVKLTQLNEKLRTVEKKHVEALSLVKNEAAGNVRATQEERQALRARVEQLRGKLESERKEWQNTHRPMADDLQKCKTRLQLVDKELQEARYRERSSFQLKEKMAGEVLVYKRKVADLSTALQEALHGKSELKTEHTMVVKHMKDRWREMLRSYHHSKEQLMMLQEDYNGLFRSRRLIEEENEHLYEAMQELKVRHEQAIRAKDAECWEIEKKYKKVSVTCPQCLKTPEQKQQEVQCQLDAAREQTRLEVTKNLELERWDRFQEVNSKYMDVCRQLQTAVQECDQLKNKCKAVTNQHQELQETERKLTSMLEEAQAKMLEMNTKRDQEAQQMEGTKKTMQDLVENLTSLTAVTADQSKKLQEVEKDRLEEHERLAEQICNLEAEKQSLTQDHEQLTKRYEEFVAQYELLKQEKSKHWNEIVQAQLSANLLIEEQAHTIDDLLQAKAAGTYVSPSKMQSSSNSGQLDSSAVSRLATDTPDHASPKPLVVAVPAFHDECEVLREEVARLKVRFRDERTVWQSNNEKKESEYLREIKALQLERQKLKKRLEEQALTIHELTLQEEEEDEDGSESFIYSNGKVASDFGFGASSSCVESCLSLESQSDVNARRTPTYPIREPGVGFWLPPQAQSSPSRDGNLSKRPKNRSAFKSNTNEAVRIGSATAIG